MNFIVVIIRMINWGKKWVFFRTVAFAIEIYIKLSPLLLLHATYFSLGVGTSFFLGLNCRIELYNLLSFLKGSNAQTVLFPFVLSF